MHFSFTFSVFIFECCSCFDDIAGFLKRIRVFVYECCYDIAVQTIENFKSIIQNWLNFVCQM